MIAILAVAYRLLMAVWVGIIVYFTAVLTPTVNRAFPEQFGEIVAALFPGYFRLGEVLAAAALLLALGQWLATRSGTHGGERGGIRWRLLLAAAALALVAYNREILLPQAHVAPRGTELFSRLHGLSMAVNVVTALLALVGAVLGGTGEKASGAPARSGGRPRSSSPS